MIARFIGWRYLVSKRAIRFINVIGAVSVAGIAVGVAALVVALSVFNGFNSVVTGVLVGFDPHLRIERPGGLSDSDYAAVEALMGSTAGVSAWSPYISGKAIISAGQIQKVVEVRGIEPGKIGSVTGLQSRLVLGGLPDPDSELPGIVLGIALADRLRSVVEAEVGLTSPAGLQGAAAGTGAPRTEPFGVSGVYESDNKEYDANFAYVTLDDARFLFGRRAGYSGVDVRATDLARADELKESLAARLGAGFTVSTWHDLHRHLYTVMLVERWSAYILLSLIIAVASFNVLSSLTMSVIEKRRDIAVLRAFGMRGSMVGRIFLFEGLITGAAGTLGGILLGLAVVLLQDKFGLVPLDPTIYIIPAIPVEIRAADFIAVTAASMLISTLSALYPARRAAATEPAEALRWQ